MLERRQGGPKPLSGEKPGLGSNPSAPKPKPHWTPKRYGPYQLQSGHWIWIDQGAGGKKDKRSVLVHREIMEQHIGRKLGPEEVVHHRDGNPSNNAIDNLEIKDHRQHAADHARPPKMVTIKCRWCGRTSQKRASQVRGNQVARGCRGPFCDKSCSGKWSRGEQIKAGRVNLRA